MEVRDVLPRDAIRSIDQPRFGTDHFGAADDEVIVVERGDGSLHAFAAPGVALAVADGDLRGDGRTWDPVTGGSTDGRRLTRAPAVRRSASAWQDAHGPASLRGPAD